MLLSKNRQSMTNRGPGARPSTIRRGGGRISPKHQILLVALGFFLLNLVLIAIWAWALFGR